MNLEMTMKMSEELRRREKSFPLLRWKGRRERKYDREHHERRERGRDT